MSSYPLVVACPERDRAITLLDALCDVVALVTGPTGPPDGLAGPASPDGPADPDDGDGPDGTRFGQPSPPPLDRGQVVLGRDLVLELLVVLPDAGTRLPDCLPGSTLGTLLLAQPAEPAEADRSGWLAVIRRLPRPLVVGIPADGRPAELLAALGLSRDTAYVVVDPADRSSVADAVLAVLSATAATFTSPTELPTDPG